MTTPGDGKDKKAKNRLQKLVDWVNADGDQTRPPAREKNRPPKDAPLAAHRRERVKNSEHPVTRQAIETEDYYEGDNEFEYPDERAYEEIESLDKDYIAGDETFATVPHEALPLTIQQKRQMKRLRLFYLLLSAVVALNLIVILLLTVGYLPEFGTPDRPAINEVYTRYTEQVLTDTGVPNMVAAVLFSYRSFDTLGEAFVLFTAVIAVMILLQKPDDDDVKGGHTDGTA
jgi:hypothetical protein